MRWNWAMLELFDWADDENESCFRSGIADSLFAQGKREETFASYESWLENDPQNCNGISGYSWILVESGNVQKAYEVVRKVTWGISCNADNSFLFMRAKQLAEQVGRDEESKWFQEQLDKFDKTIHDYKIRKQKLTTSLFCDIPVVLCEIPF